MIILGVNSAYHETAAAIMVDGEVVAAAEEERFSRVKHGHPAVPIAPKDLPWKAIRYCLDAAGVSPTAVDWIGYSLDPERRYRHFLARGFRQTPSLDGWGTREGERTFLKANLEARERLRAYFPRAGFIFLPHHLCHAASAFFCSPWQEAGVLVVDGIGEDASLWAGHGRDNELECLWEVKDPNSLGFLWEQVSTLLGGDAYDGPGKVMAMGTMYRQQSPKTGADYEDVFGQIVKPEVGGRFTVDPAVIDPRSPDLRGLESLLGPKRPFLGKYEEDFRVAAGLQAVTENTLIDVAEELYRRIQGARDGLPVRSLCVAGGVALNCAANWRLLDDTHWDHLWIQPAAHDAGTALGAALVIWHLVLGERARGEMRHAFLGPSFSSDTLRQALDASGVQFDEPVDLAQSVARLLASGEIVAWFQGAMEYGPRALGHRSFLADPRRRISHSRLSTKIKGREWFRPLAPSVSRSELPNLIHSPLPEVESPGRTSTPLHFMLMAVPVTQSAAKRIPAAIHRNSDTGAVTARVQLVDERACPELAALLEAWREESGIGALVNTSLNIKGPIVRSPQEALALLTRGSVEYLAMGPFLAKMR